MMASAQTIKNELNKKYTPKIAVLGPATAQPPPVGGSPTDFTTLLIASLKKPITFAGASKSYSFNPKDAQFGWSQHNYGDVEHVANMLGTFPPAVLVGILQLQHPEFFFSLFYGGGTQRVRNLLRSGGTTTAVTAGTSWWQGAKSASDPNPGLWLSEGGCRLDNVVVFPGTRYPRTATGALVDPSTNYSTNPPSDPVPGFKQLQGWAIAGAANALSRNGGGQPGEGVEMFTNFLFYDEPPSPIPGKGGNFSGLCDEYGPDQQPPQTETSAQQERPAFGDWTLFGTGIVR
jgi:hypothetical protein